LDRIAQICRNAAPPPIVPAAPESDEGAPSLGADKSHDWRTVSSVVFLFVFTIVGGALLKSAFGSRDDAEQAPSPTTTFQTHRQQLPLEPSQSTPAFERRPQTAAARDTEKYLFEAYQKGKLADVEYTESMLISVGLGRPLIDHILREQAQRKQPPGIPIFGQMTGDRPDSKRVPNSSGTRP
jgi:hypothetical protein